MHCGCRTIQQINSFTLLHFFGGILNRIDNMRITRAAAQVALDAVGDLFAAGFRVALEQLDSGHDHTRRAVTALQPVAFPETFLHRMKLTISSEALDSGHFGTVGLDGKNGAGLHRAAILQDGAGATNAGFAAYVGAGQFAKIAQEVNEKHARLDFVLLLDAVNFYSNETFHIASESAVGVLVLG
jgi:hypothetical protein